MLKRLYNEALLTLNIKTEGPLLVRSGYATLSGPDMTPVLTYRNGDRQVYIPGSSLKGVMRSHTEKICRTLRADPHVVCNPFVKLKDTAVVDRGRLTCPDYADVFCGDKFELRAADHLDLKERGGRWLHDPEEHLSTAGVYADSCPICRLFGSTSFIGRVSVNDAYLAPNQPGPFVEQRDGVGIDRLTGGSSHGALFNLEAVTSGITFTTKIHVRNFEIWQLGLVLLFVQDMAAGLVRIGSGRSRGMGSVTADVDEVKVGYIGLVDENALPPARVWGLGKFLGVGTAYNTSPGDVLELTAAPTQVVEGIRLYSTFSGDSLKSLQARSQQAFVAALRQWRPRPQMADVAQLGFHR